ncbi:MAG: Apolipoprotein N-acyltransferase [Bryobacteraceae bacterium]|nr:Apolipoprotein N-acyltransferase [Bryobacteraceae bacterium]
MKPLALALLSALLAVAAFPSPGLSFLAPFCFVPLLLAIAWEPDPKRRLLCGWAAGIVYWAGICYWIGFVLEQYGGMSLPLVWLSFSLFCILKAMNFAAFGYLAGFLIHSRWAILATAALWTGLERVYGPFGFAWFALGNAGIGMSVPMRLAPVTGVYGLSFVFFLINAAVALLILRRPRLHIAPLLLLPLLLLLPPLPSFEEGTRTAVAVQPNIEEREDWTATMFENTLRREVQLTLDVAANASPRPDMVLWPEVPAPYYYETDPFFREQVTHVARTARTDFLFGAVARTPGGAPLNSVFELGPEGGFVARYDKINLVPFGEYVPPLFNWIQKISSEAGSFAPGSVPSPLPLTAGKAGVFICYESVFPHYVRQFVADGAGVLVNLSNDGYFGHSAARDQHLLIARMRAAENGRWLIRATNDGITVAIDPAGRITGRLNPYTQAAARLRFSWRADETPYTRYGDWFVWSCLAAGLLACAAGLRRYFLLRPIS